MTAIATCQTCGTELLENARFCHGCGSPVENAGIRAEYKQVTVLFADVVHSMDIAATVGTERLREIMAELVNITTAVVQRYGGTVDKFTGDGIMAVFGAPVAMEDHAVRACRAALGIQDATVRLAAEVKDHDGIDLRLRVGLNSGQVISGEIGSGALGYTAVGEQVGMAQRMESVAPPGGVMLSASTARLVEGATTLGESELVEIKGGEAPVPARRLLGMGEEHRVTERAESSLVGRRWELSAVESLLDRAVDGDGAVVGVVGAPGIGKSRLVREVAAIARRRNVEVFTTFCESHATDVPFRVVARLLRTATGVEGLDAQAARAQVRARVRDADPEDLALFDDLLGIADPDTELPKIDRDARRRRLTALVNAASLARETPALYVIEDVHWIDEVSESMLADFLMVIPQMPSLVLVTYRPEYEGALARVHGAQTIALAPLSVSETAALVSELLGPDSSVGALGQTIAERAAGNPFFAEEIVRELAERGVLQGRTGAYVSTADVSEAKVPATLQAAIAARIDRLDAKAKRTLSAAAVVGSGFRLDLLTELGVEPVVDELVAAQLIDQVRFTRQPEYVFHHPLIRAVAYESQLKSDRAQMHRQLAAAIEARWPESADQNAALIAEHLEAAGDRHAAYGWHVRAATWATYRDIAAARLGWERAEKIADALPAEDPLRAAMRIAPRAMLCGTAWHEYLSVAGDRFEELRELCTEAGDKASLAIGMVGLVVDHAYQGRVREASQLASEHMALIESLGDPILTVQLSFAPILAKILSGEWSDVLRWSQRVIDLADADTSKGNFAGGSPLPPFAYAFMTRAIARYCLGRPGWRDDLRHGLAMARSADPYDPYLNVVTIIYAYLVGISVGVLAADDRAVREFEDAVGIAERSGNDWTVKLARGTLGLALVHRPTDAERDRGQTLLTELSDVFWRRGYLLGALPLMEVYLAREQARCGDRDEAIPLMRAAVDHLFREGRLLAWGIPAMGVLVETLLDRGADGDVAEAEAAIERLAVAPAEDGLVIRDVWLLRLRALLARARGEEVSYRDLAQRYRALATSLGFEGHMAMAEAMTSSAGEYFGAEIVSPLGRSAMPATRDGVPRGRIRRTMPLAGFTARATGGRIVAGLREKTGDAGAVARFHVRTAERYSQLLGHSKGVLMKVGQILSMLDANSVGIGFSPYQVALARLQADAPPMDPDLAKDMVRADLGRPAEEVFSQFTDEPMAAASIGQVHRAVLHDGREVAVKIQYPGAAEAIGDDLANHELLTTFFQLVSSASGATMPDLRPATREIATRIAEEIDYRHEAANITAFSELYRGHPFIRIPDVIGEASGDRVLTMTYLDGLDWAAAQRADQDLKNTWAEVISRFMAGSFRHANLFQADPHPGNYRFGPDGRVGFVDFGCVKVLYERQRRKLVGMVRAAVEGHKHELRDLMVQTGFLASNSTLTVEEAYEWWSGLAHELLAPQPFTYTHDAAKRAIWGMIDVRAADHPVRRLSMPGDFVFFSRLTFGMNTIFATLQATLAARSILDDLDGVAEPVTPLGKQHHAWVRRRGLPCGLEAHDHP